MTQLDDHGARIIGFIERYQREKGHSPSYREIGAAVGIPSKDHVSRDLKRLERAGFLSLTPRTGRSIVLLRNTRSEHRRADRAIPLPIVGTIKPRQPIPDGEKQGPPIDWITVGRELVADEQDVYVLRVEGDSMIDALVNHGDLVVIKRTRAAQNGEMIAVWLRTTGKLGLKYFYRENGHVRLQPANPELPAMHVQPTDVEIQGQVLAIMRKAT